MQPHVAQLFWKKKAFWQNHWKNLYFDLLTEKRHTAFILATSAMKKLKCIQTIYHLSLLVQFLLALYILHKCTVGSIDHSSHVRNHLYLTF